MGGKPCFRTHWNETVRAKEGPDYVKYYIDSTLAKEQKRKKGFKLFEVQAFYQQKVGIRKSKNEKLNSDIYDWVKDGVLNGVNFLSMNFICTKGSEISKLLGVSQSEY